MFHPDQLHAEIPDAAATTIVTPVGACLVAGCPCKDARIVSHRRAAFFAAVARRNGQTADRTMRPDPTWSWTTPMTGVES